MHSIPYTKAHSSSPEKRLRSYSQTQKQIKHSRKLKQSLVNLRDVPANHISALEQQVDDLI